MLCSLDQLAVLNYKKNLLTLHPDKGGNSNDFMFINNAFSFLKNDEYMNKYRIKYNNLISPQKLCRWTIELSESDMYSTKRKNKIIETSFLLQCDECTDVYVYDKNKYMTMNPTCKCDQKGNVLRTLQHKITPGNINMLPIILTINNKHNQINVMIDYTFKLKNCKIDHETGNVFKLINISHNDYIDGFTRHIELPWDKKYLHEYHPVNKFINPVKFMNRGISTKDSSGDFFLIFVIN
ncbi:low complexity protein [Salmon gill poxvirus]|nr:low complexity protein [Salmon gill poxvirus]